MKVIKVMLDECITKRCAHAIIDVLKLQNPPVQAHFLLTYMGHQGALDCDWTLQLTPPEEWIVISSDAGRTGARIHAKGPPLHLILPKRGITGFFLRGKTLTQSSGADRAIAVISKIPRILELSRNCIAGSRFKMSRSGAGYVISEWACLDDRL